MCGILLAQQIPQPVNEQFSRESRTMWPYVACLGKFHFFWSGWQKARTVIDHVPVNGSFIHHTEFMSMQSSCFFHRLDSLCSLPSIKDLNLQRSTIKGVAWCCSGNVAKETNAISGWKVQVHFWKISRLRHFTIDLSIFLIRDLLLTWKKKFNWIIIDKTKDLLFDLLQVSLQISTHHWENGIWS